MFDWLVMANELKYLNEMFISYMYFQVGYIYIQVYFWKPVWKPLFFLNWH